MNRVSHGLVIVGIMLCLCMFLSNAIAFFGWLILGFIGLCVSPIKCFTLLDGMCIIFSGPIAFLLRAE